VVAAARYGPQDSWLEPEALWRALEGWRESGETDAAADDAVLAPL
jgi:hypothetical protein